MFLLTKFSIQTNLQVFLNIFYDHYKTQLKFFVSGSSSLEIKKKFKERLTGRVYQFNLFPLDFNEFLSFKKEKENKRSLFEEFIRYGRYPEIVKKDDFLIKEKDLNEIYSLYVKKDIKDLGRIEDVFSFNKLVKALANQIGNLVNEVELSNFCQISRQIIRKYLFLLENTYIVKFITPFFTNKRKELAKMPKVYYLDTGLRNCVLENYPFPVKTQEFSQLVENFVATELIKKTNYDGGEIHFWRTQSKQEVDFVYIKKNTILPIEVKYTSFKEPKISSSLKFFIKHYQAKRAFVITKDFFNKAKFFSSEISFIPAWRLEECDF